MITISQQPASRLKLLERLDVIVRELSQSPYLEAIDEIYLLGSLISTKANPNDIDLMIIGSFSISNQSVLRSQQQIRNKIVSLSSPIDFSINFGESIESIKFQDGTPLESYLLIYSRFFEIDWRAWFDQDGSWRLDLIMVLGTINTHALRWDYPTDHLKMVPYNEDWTKLEEIPLPREAIWTFLHKRFNVSYPDDKWELFHPAEWTGCNRCGNCCRDFDQLRSRFVAEVPQLFDIIQTKFAGKLWNSIEIESEAALFWIVEMGLDQSEIDTIKQANPSMKIIPCPFWKSGVDSDSESTCLIYESRPNGCKQFPEYHEDLIRLDCI